MCDFQDAGICQYTQDKDENFDWSRMKGSTSSVSTGPQTDHTYGTLDGMILHMKIEYSKSPTYEQVTFQELFETGIARKSDIFF